MGVISLDLYNDMSECILNYFKKNVTQEQYNSVLKKSLSENPFAETNEQQSYHRASELIHIFLNYDNRCIKPIPRNVYYSKELEHSLVSDYTNYINVIDDIVRKLRNGQSVMDRLSKKMKDVLYEDGMLNDWRLYHFHLGEKVDNDFCERTGALLIGFIPLNKDDMYLIKIIPNHRGNAVFADKELIEIIQDNWPELLDKFRMNGVSPEVELSTQQYYKLRKTGVVSLVKIGDSSYLGPGLGVTCAGTSIQVQIKADKIINWLSESKLICRELMCEYVPEQIPQCLNFYVELNMDKRVFVITSNRPCSSPKIMRLKNIFPF